MIGDIIKMGQGGHFSELLNVSLEWPIECVTDVCSLNVLLMDVQLNGL